MTILAAALPEFLGSFAAACALSLCTLIVRRFRGRPVDDGDRNVDTQQIPRQDGPGQAVGP
ncbi:hypothetical protein AB0941_37105 [Streptomyces sp. NPDC013433]|uniref:hypothetical protein n=1 Tax=Streptomyces sp. NPDC013433 TaxID=3155604 RepID=UPI003452EB7E